MYKRQRLNIEGKKDTAQERSRYIDMALALETTRDPRQCMRIIYQLRGRS